MRLVFVDSESNRVCGDTAALAARCPEWVEASSHDTDLESLARTAARLLDESSDKTFRTYQFVSFAPQGHSKGYFVFRCECEGDRALPPVSDQSDPADTISAVMTSCFYVGYVQSDILIM